MLKTSSINIFKLILLAGPDRLLRIAFTLEHEFYHNEKYWTEEYETITYIINGLLIQKHSCTATIDKEYFFSWIRTIDNDSYDGLIRIELLIRKNKPSEVTLNYYSKELELARKFFEIESFYKINSDVDPENYPAPYRLIDLREGNEQSLQTFPVKVKKISKTDV
ncbi:MAG: hypothetical protein ABJH98_17635 [Reichenbachiella sp.]|uniref:hypothetical protein n=1 Tax=Reichenbachiella sp. TaxID=2184521 RepID=UPI003296C627